MTKKRYFFCRAKKRNTASDNYSSDAQVTSQLSNQAWEAGHVSRQAGKEEEEIVRQLRQRVAILLVRDNVNMFDSRTPSFPQAVIDADVDNNY